MNCKVPTWHRDELIVVERKFEDDRFHYRPVFVDVFDISTAERFIERERKWKCYPGRDDFLDWQIKMISKPYRHIWCVERCFEVRRDEILSTWCDDVLDAEELAAQQNVDDAGTLFNSHAIQIDMEDDEILQIFFEGDEEVFEKHLGCIPSTYDNLVDPMRNIPYPDTLSLFPKENTR